MKKFLKIVAYALLALVLVAVGYGLWWILIDGRPGPGRPDLVRLPDDAPAPPFAYPTRNALMAAIATGRLDLMDLEDPLETGGVKLTTDIEYGNADGVPLLLDIYEPETPREKPVPALIFIHGGGWNKGNKDDYGYYGYAYARRGYTVISVGYRLTTVAPHPACIQDVKCAVRWIRANADKHNIDPERLVALGGSAGGHLAMMVGYSADVPALEGDSGNPGVSSAVAAVVNLYGVTDLRVPEAINDSRVLALTGATIDENPAPFDEASPITYVDKDDPPTLILHGNLDIVSPVTQSDMLAEKFQELGVPYWYDRIAGYPHTMDLAPAVNERVQWLIQRFLEEHLPGGTAPAG